MFLGDGGCFLGDGDERGGIGLVVWLEFVSGLYEALGDFRPNPIEEVALCELDAAVYHVPKSLHIQAPWDSNPSLVSLCFSGHRPSNLSSSVIFFVGMRTISDYVHMPSLTTSIIKFKIFVKLIE